MNVFISWSGPRSRAIAIALRDWLPLALHAAAPFMSEVDIAAGQRWANELDTHMESMNVGIVVVTPGNQHAPGLMFEAGALGKAVGRSKVIPLLSDVDIPDLLWPLAQFQARFADRDGLLAVVKSVNEELGDRRLNESKVTDAFELAWPRLEAALRQAAATTGEIPTAPRPTEAEQVAEILLTVRTMAETLSGLAGTVRKLVKRTQPSPQSSLEALLLPAAGDDQPERNELRDALIRYRDERVRKQFIDELFPIEDPQAPADPQ